MIHTGSKFRRRDQFIVARRLPGEHQDIREFVRPNDYAVKRFYESRLFTTEPPLEQVEALFGWVCENIRYPKDQKLSRDISFDGYHARILDYWPFPAETLANPHVGDCDARANLLASAIRIFAPPEDVYVVLGGWKRDKLEHAWVEWKGGILETTEEIPDEELFESARNYFPMVRYNDKEIFVKDGCQEHLPLIQADIQGALQPVGALVEVNIPWGSIAAIAILSVAGFLLLKD